MVTSTEFSQHKSQNLITKKTPHFGTAYIFTRKQEIQRNLCPNLDTNGESFGPLSVSDAFSDLQQLIKSLIIMWPGAIVQVFVKVVSLVNHTKWTKEKPPLVSHSL